MKKTKRKSLLLNGVLVVFVLGISLFLAEIGYRVILFKNIPAFAKLRNSNLYADYFSDDDYWKLYYLFDGPFKPPANPHPVLGWVGEFQPDTYRHQDFDNIEGRRPVLLYGDSFAQCIKNVHGECFQDVLNSDPAFSKDHYFLNYGVGGYGVGQIFLLFQKSIHLYKNPFVIFSLMTLDLDRTILSVRTGQKPLYTLENDQLKLCGVPMYPNPADFFANHPPQVISYIYRRILYSNLLPQGAASFLRQDDKVIEKKEAVNRAIILETVKELKAMNLDFVFLVFHPNWAGISTLSGEDCWRDRFLEQVFEENRIPYIWSKGLYKKDHEKTGKAINDYIILGNGHPTGYFNRIIAGEMEKSVFMTEASRISRR